MTPSGTGAAGAVVGSVCGTGGPATNPLKFTFSALFYCISSPTPCGNSWLNLLRRLWGCVSIAPPLEDEAACSSSLLPTPGEVSDFVNVFVEHMTSFLRLQRNSSESPRPVATACLKACFASCPYPIMSFREMFLKRPDNIREFAAGE